MLRNVGVGATELLDEDVARDAVEVGGALVEMVLLLSRSFSRMERADKE